MQCATLTKENNYSRKRSLYS